MREIRFIRPFLDFKTATIIATSIDHSKRDYCNIIISAAKHSLGQSFSTTNILVTRNRSLLSFCLWNQLPDSFDQSQTVHFGLTSSRTCQIIFVSQLTNLIIHYVPSHLFYLTCFTPDFAQPSPWTIIVPTAL